MQDAELMRYPRHILLPEIGIEGQERIRQGRVLQISAGGLGSAAAMYLAASGVGFMQAAEALKLLLGSSQTLAGRILMLQAQSMEFTELRRQRNPACSVCGQG